ncbi:MAG: hypothetical protein P4L90_25985 [Rhodopila sp.]|nr:hypothetical protein [Rhodopila sp.]
MNAITDPITSTDRFTAHRQAMLARLREFLADPAVSSETKADTARETISAIEQMTRLVLERQ